ncbi:ABC transporter permease [Anaeromicrobium sediminis]|uniref:Iron ABC transporter n=1 Tax=Anaeromicrobium sediminis TaxID=1478221 RepID=A0A267MLI5_9FIRM|nr:iron ABC transporter permease [Anaeromicrobium sediminis]PAB59768.1 iron ABC transporter [Anaeromicrobium sediminis]
MRWLKMNLNLWSVLSTVFVLLIILPNLNIMISLFNEPNENWIHIKKYLLKDYMINSTILTVCTGILSMVIGTSLAWITTMYEFPFRKVLEIGLILPLGIPPYMGAYTYAGILNYTGIIQSFLRNNFGIYVNQKYFDIMSINGAIFIFTIFLFPYVYLITKSFLEKQSADLVENGRVLGRSQLEIFIHVILPVARAAIVGGVSLVILEVLNDYGVVKYFGVPAFSTAIFKTWFAMGDIDSAIRLASVLMILVFTSLMIEKFLRSRKKFSYSTAKVRPLVKIKLEGIKSIGAFMYSFIIFSLGFLIPTLQLIHWALMTYEKILNHRFIKLMGNSLIIAIITSVLIVIISIIIGNYNRINESTLSKAYSKITVVGYSIPGSVIALGVIVFFIGIDRKFGWIYEDITFRGSKLILSSSIIMLLFAYVIRFLTIGYNSIEAGFEKVGKRFFEASRTLGMGIIETFFKVDLKMIKPGIVGASILVFVDVLKELPLTLILRPFNFDTLATKAFEYASDEMIHEASIGSLIIILVSSISIIFFNFIVNRRGNNEH